MASVAKKTLFNAQAVSGASTTSSVLSLDGRTDNFIAFLNATALGAGTTLSAKIQHSPNNSNWFDLVSFTATNVVAAESKDQASFGVAFQNVYPNIRAIAALAGGTTTATLTVELYYDPTK